eukprot:5459582-Pyramimonas_sp.AAC.1
MENAPFESVLEYSPRSPTGDTVNFRRERTSSTTSITEELVVKSADEDKSQNSVKISTKSRVLSCVTGGIPTTSANRVSCKRSRKLQYLHDFFQLPEEEVCRESALNFSSSRVCTKVLAPKL